MLFGVMSINLGELSNKMHIKTAENLVKNALAHMEWGGRMRKSGQPAKRLEEKIYAVTKKHEADGGGRPGPEYGSLYSSGTCIGWLYH